MRRSVGRAAGDGSAPCSPETRFQAGSISKQVMTVVALGLVEAGRVDGTFIGRVLGADGWFVPGDNPGFQSVLTHVPEQDADLAVLSNDAAGVRPALEDLRRDSADGVVP